MRLYGLGKLVGGRGMRNLCKIDAFVKLWRVSWEGGASEIIVKSIPLYVLGRLVGGPVHQKSLRHQRMCLILGRWFGGGTRIISKSRNLYGFGKLVGGRGIGNHCKILASDDALDRNSFLNQ